MNGLIFFPIFRYSQRVMYHRALLPSMQVMMKRIYRRAAESQKKAYIERELKEMNNLIYLLYERIEKDN